VWQLPRKRMAIDKLRQDRDTKMGSLDLRRFSVPTLNINGRNVNIGGPDDTSPSQPSHRILIRNNLIDDIDGDKWGSAAYGPADGKFAQLVGGPADVTFDHNTIFHSGSLIVADGSPSPGFVFRNNIARNNLYGVIGSDRSPGLDSLRFYFPGCAFKKNVIVGVPPEIKYPADNFLLPVLGRAGFVDLAGGDYRLAPASPYKNAGADGKDVGCDFSALNPEGTKKRGVGSGE